MTKENREVPLQVRWQVKNALAQYCQERYWCGCTTTVEDK